MNTTIGQHLIIGISGTTLTPDEAKLIIENDIGGVILFRRNFESPRQLHELISHLHSLKNQTASQSPLFISVDMEGGRISQLPGPFTQWPSAQKLGGLDSTSAAFRMAMAMGEELTSFGFNMDNAPCVDVLTNPQNILIGDRALSTDAESVAKIASALVRGFLKSGIEPCAKHFPGHGHTVIDSHEALPIETKSLDEMRSCELVPYKKVFRARVNFVMMAHVMYEKIDPNWPASLSPRWIQDILQEELRFKQFVVADDLDMKALTNNWDKATIARQAIIAGNHLLLYCHDFDSPRLAIEALKEGIKTGKITKAQLENTCKKIIDFKAQNFPKEPASLPYDKALELLKSPIHMRLSQAIEAGNVPADLLVMES